MISGVAIADRCRPASPPQMTWIVSAQISGASGRGMMQCASIRASSQDGPSGSADWMTIVRDGWRPVSIWIVAAHRSASSGRRATTTRFITLVRAATWRDISPSISTVRSCAAQILVSSISISAMLWARAVQRRIGSPGVAGVDSAVAGVTAASESGACVGIAGLVRSGASAGRRARSARRLRAGPTVPAS